MGRLWRGVGGLIPPLPAPVWTIIGLHGLASLGGGIVLAFLTIYLHFVRGIDLGVTGLAFAALPVGAMVMGPLSGTLTDRVGPRLVIAGGGLLAAGATLSLAAVSSAWQAILVALLLGAGMTCFEAPVYTLLATSVPTAGRSAVFALDYAVIALGWGAGGFIGGFIVDLGSVATFQFAFVLATACLVTFAVMVFALPRQMGNVGGGGGGGGGGDETLSPPPPPSPTTKRDAPSGSRGYRRVLRDRCMPRILTVSFVLLAFSYVQFDVTFPAVAIGSAGVGTRVIGLAFLANMLTICLGQLVVLRLLAGRRRTGAMVLMCIFSAVCWLVVLAAAHVGGGLLAAALLISSFVIVAFAEMTWSPSVPGMVNDLAPPVVRGRYNAANSFAEASGRLVGPIVAGFLLEAGIVDAWLVVMVVVTLACIPVVYDLRRLVPAGADCIGRADGSAVCAVPTPPVL